MASGICAVGLSLITSKRQNLIVSAIFSSAISCGNAALDCLITEIFPTNLRWVFFFMTKQNLFDTQTMVIIIFFRFVFSQSYWNGYIHGGCQTWRYYRKYCYCCAARSLLSITYLHSSRASYRYVLVVFIIIN